MHHREGSLDCRGGYCREPDHRGSGPGARCGEHPGPSHQFARPCLSLRPEFKHRVRGRSCRRETAGGDPLGRSDAWESESALQGATARAWDGLFARSSDTGRGVHRLQFGGVHRHGDQSGETHHVRRSRPPRGDVHTGRQRGLGHGAWGRLRAGARRHELPSDAPHSGAEWPRHDDLLPWGRVRIRVLEFYPGDGRHRHQNPPAGRAHAPGLAVLPRHRGYPRWAAGLVDAEGHRQDTSIQCETTLQ